MSFRQKKKSSESLEESSFPLFFMFEADGQAPVRAVQCLPSTRLIQPEAGCDAYGLGPPQTEGHQTPTSLGNLTPPQTKITTLTPKIVHTHSH